jgi:hypothetical protein
MGSFKRDRDKSRAVRARRCSLTKQPSGEEFEKARNPLARAEFAMSVMTRGKKSPVLLQRGATMTSPIGTVLGANGKKIAHLRAVRIEEVLSIVFEFTKTASKTWQDRLVPAATGKIEFMLDGSLRLTSPSRSRQKSIPLNTVIAKLSANKLRLQYHSHGVDEAFELKRQIWHDDTEVLSLPELALRLQKYWPARQNGR